MQTDSQLPNTVSAGRLLRHNKTYRAYWLANIGSQFGDQFNQVALAETTLLLTHSAVSLGLVLLCRSLPSVLLGAFVGPVVDKYSRRNLMLISDFTRMFFALGYVFAFICASQPLLYVSSLLLGISSVVFGPARSALIPKVVTKQELVYVNAFESAISGFLQIIGALCGGVAGAVLSPVICFIINSVSYAWSGICILVAGTVNEHEVYQERRPYLESLIDGFREVRHNKTARAIILIGISWGLAGGGYYILVPLLGVQHFAAASIGIGVLYALDGFGVLVGAFLVQRLVGSGHRKSEVWYGLAYVTQALFFVLMTQHVGFLAASLSLFLMRVSSGVIIPLDTYLLQVGTGQHVRGRVFSLHSATYGGFMQLSYAGSGIAFETLGIPTVGVIIGITSLLCGVSWLTQFGRNTPETKSTMI